MVDDTTSDDNTTTNKGVNVHSESLAAGVLKCTCDHPDSSSSVSSNAPDRSLTDIKNEIQNVLDLMGPSTPNLTSAHQNTSSEADNEDSVLSATQVSDEVKKSKLRSRTPSDRKSTRSASEVFENNDSSIFADVGTASSLTNNFDSFDNVEFPKYDKAEPHLCLNPDCIYMMGYMNQTSVPVTVVPPKTCEGYFSTTNKSARATTSGESKKKRLLEWFRSRPFDLVMKRSATNPCELYKINISGHEDDGGPPKRVVFDLIGGIPKPSSSTVATNTIRNPVEKCKTKSLRSISKCKNDASLLKCECKDIKNMRNETITLEQESNKAQRHVSHDSDGNARVDFYYFDHGNAQYFHTTDTPPVMMCEIIAEKTEKYTTKFWAEVFATIHIAFSFCISFILQLFKFLLYSIIRPLSVGLIQLLSDYLFKPFLTTLFNGVIQPCLIFLYNVATSFRDLCDPIAEGIGYFFREIAVVFRAIRLCTYKRNINEDNCECNKLYGNCTSNKKNCV